LAFFGFWFPCWAKALPVAKVAAEASSPKVERRFSMRVSLCFDKCLLVSARRHRILKQVS
jgi:hypothetical protein